MTRSIAWNGRGTTVLNAALRATVEGVANRARRDVTVNLAVGTSITAVIDGTNVTVDGEVLGTLTGVPDLPNPSQ